MVRCIIWLALGCILATASGAEAQVSGKAVFQGKGNCHTCHGANGTGTELAPNLTDGEWLNINGSLAAIKGLIRSGVPKPKKFPGAMPAKGGAELTNAEIDAVAAYVHSLSRQPSSSSRAAVASRDSRKAKPSRLSERR